MWKNNKHSLGAFSLPLLSLLLLFIYDNLFSLVVWVSVLIICFSNGTNVDSLRQCSPVIRLMLSW